MNGKFKLKYKETKEILNRICELYVFDNSDMTFKFILGAMGPMVLVFMLIYGNHGVGEPGGTGLFLIKYLVAYVLIFAAAMIFNRTLWLKISEFTAVAHAEEQYSNRIAVNGKAAEIQMAFDEDCFHHQNSITGAVKDYPYDRVTKIVESKSAIGLVVKTKTYAFGGPAGMYGFPKNSLTENEVEELKKYLLGKCTNVKHGIKKFQGAK